MADHQSVLNGIYFFVGLTIALVDIRTHRIPNRALVVLLVLDGLSLLLSNRLISIPQLIISLVATLSFYLGVNLAKPGAIGMGDIKYTLVAVTHLGIGYRTGLITTATFLISCWVLGGLIAGTLRFVIKSERFAFAPAIFIALNVAQNYTLF